MARGGGTEISRLVTRIEVDLSDAQRQLQSWRGLQTDAASDMQRGSRAARELGDALSYAGRGGQVAAQGLRVAAVSAKDIAVGFGAALLGVNLLQAGGVAAGRLIAESFRGLASAAIGMNSLLETSQLQFKVLTGSAEQAAEITSRAFAFAKESPFETGPIIEVARMLEVMGGAALNTDANLRLVADAAAGATRPIQEVGLWVSRAYSQIQGGRPFGEAAEELQRMGLLSGQARNRLEGLQQMGASGPEIWAAFTQSLSRFSGTSKDLAQTWTGLTSTFSDSTRLLTAEALKPFFDLIKEGVGTLNTLLDSGQAKKWAESTAAAIRGAITSIGDITLDVRIKVQFATDLAADIKRTIDNIANTTVLDFKIPGAGVTAGGVADSLRRQWLPNPSDIKRDIDTIDRVLTEGALLAAQQWRGVWKEIFGQPLPGADAAIGELRNRQARAIDATFTAAQRKKWAAQMMPGPEDFDAGPTVAAVLSFAEQIAGAWDQAQRIHDLGDKGKSLGKAIRQGMESPELRAAALAQVLAIGEDFDRAFDPLTTTASDKTRELGRLTVAAWEANTDEAVKAAEDFAASVFSDIRIDVHKKRVADAIKAAGAERDRQIAEEKRRVHDLAVSGFVDERDRQAMIENWGYLGSDSVIALTEALADPQHGRSAGQALARNVEALVKRLEDAGVPQFREWGNRLMAAAEGAMRGHVSGGEFESILREATGALPQLSVASVFDAESFNRAIASANLPASAKRLGDLMRQNLKEGFLSAEGIADFQRAFGELLRETDALSAFDPESARRYADSFISAQRQMLEQKTPEATQVFETFIADQIRNIRLDVAQAEMQDKARKNADQLVESVQSALRGQKVQTFDLFEQLFTERGSGGVDVGRIKARVSQLLGTDLIGGVLEEQLPGSLEAARTRIMDVIDQAASQFASATSFRERQQQFQDELDQRLQALRESQKREVESVREGEAAKARERANTRQDEDAARNRGREDRDAQLSRTRQDTEARIQLNRQIQEAQKRGARPEEIEGIRSTFNQGQSDLVRRRQDEDADRARRRQDQDADRATARQRAQEDLDIQNRQRQSGDALGLSQQKAMQEQQRRNARDLQAFNDQLADEQRARQLARSAVDTQTQINAARKRFTDEDKEIQTAYEKRRAEILGPAIRADLDLWNSGFKDPVLAGIAEMGAAMQAAFEIPAGLFPQGVNPALPPVPVQPQTETESPEMDVSETGAQRIAEAIASRPNVIDGDSVDQSLAHVRANRNRSRVL